MPTRKTEVSRRSSPYVQASAALLPLPRRLTTKDSRMVYISNIGLQIPQLEHVSFVSLRGTLSWLLRLSRMWYFEKNQALERVVPFVPCLSMFRLRYTDNVKGLNPELGHGGQRRRKR